MKQEQFDTQALELLFIAGSSLDRKGKRVLIREGTVENYIWSKEELQDETVIKLLGITDKKRKWMERFLGGGRTG